MPGDTFASVKEMQRTSPARSANKASTFSEQDWHVQQTSPAHTGSLFTASPQTAGPTDIPDHPKAPTNIV